jgi:NADH:ubiquinone oxidoreductase subunit 5 (subunit L)/multisubunit Na+/H+ antiporter MnhA subunit
MSSTNRHRRVAILTGGAAWALAAALLVEVVASGPVELPGLTFDRLTGTLALLVTGLTALIAVFSTRYLQDERRLGRHLLVLAGTGASTVVFVAADTLALLVAGWLVAGAGFCALLAMSPGAGGRAALRRTAAAFAVGDLALLGALGITLATVGTLDLRALDAAALGTGAAADAVAVLLVIAALARCAQLPLHRWLPATVAAPTPVSALLHAGLVNAGGVLLVRTAPVLEQSPAALGLLFAAGAGTAVYAGAVMLTRPDVKGALAHSTMAQMGFMLVQVALGALAAAIVHIIGHAMFKAALFLGAGSAVDRRRRARAISAGRRLGHRARVTAALGLPAAMLALALILAGGLDAIGGPAAVALLAFAWASGAHAVDGWLRTGPPAGLASAAAGSAAAAGAYVGLLMAGKAFLGADLAVVDGAGLLLAAPLAALVVAATVLRLAGPPLAISPALYARLVDAGSVTLAGGARGRPPRRPAPVLAGRPAEVAS